MWAFDRTAPALKSLNSQRGATLLLAMIITMVIGLSFSILMERLLDLNQVQLRSAAAFQAQSVQTSLRMQLSSLASCNANLTASGFGATLPTLKGFSAATTAISLPSATPGQIGAVLSANTPYFGFVISQLGFGPPVQVVPGDPSYVANLFIQISKGVPQYVTLITVPIYFETDVAGNLLNCFATSSLPVAGGGGLLTAEDQICAAQGSTFVYRYHEHFCYDRGAGGALLSSAIP